MIKKISLIVVQASVFVFLFLFCFFLLNVVGREMQLPCKVDCDDHLSERYAVDSTCHLDIISPYTEHMTGAGKQWCKTNYFHLSDIYDRIFRVVYFIILPMSISIALLYSIRIKILHKNQKHHTNRISN